MQGNNTQDRHDAAKAGRKVYFTGTPCKRGHLAHRYVSNGGCLECLHPKQASIPESYGLTFSPTIMLRQPISAEHAALLKRYIIHWADQTLKGWGYKTFGDGAP